MVSSTLCPAVYISGFQNMYCRAEGIADHCWPWAVFLRCLSRCFSLSLSLSCSASCFLSLTRSVASSNALALALTGRSTGELAGMADEFTLLENKSKLCFEKMIEAGVMCKVFLWILKSTGFVQRIEDEMADKMPPAAWQVGPERERVRERERERERAGDRMRNRTKVFFVTIRSYVTHPKGRLQRNPFMSIK